MIICCNISNCEFNDSGYCSRSFLKIQNGGCRIITGKYSDYSTIFDDFQRLQIIDIEDYEVLEDDGKDLLCDGQQEDNV